MTDCGGRLPCSRTDSAFRIFVRLRESRIDIGGGSEVVIVRTHRSNRTVSDDGRAVTLIRSCSVVVCTLVLSCSAPAAKSDYRPEVQRILGDMRYEWVSRESPNTRLHYPAGSFAEQQRDQLSTRAEEARSSVVHRLNARDYSGSVDLFYVDSRADMEHLVGLPVTGFAYPDEQAVVLVYNATWRSFERHELTHVVTLGTWPDPAGPAVVEGLATYVDGFCGGYENGRVARAIHDAGTGVALETLAEEFRNLDDLVAYLQAASLIEFAVERNGQGAIPNLWESGLSALPELPGISIDGEFELQFASWLTRTYDPIPANSWKAIREYGCGVDSRPGQ